MSFRIVLITSLITLSIVSCDNSKKSGEVASYTYEEETVEMNPELKVAIPDWVEVGKICYGLVVQIDSETKEPLRGQPVRAKVVQVNENAVKMKSLESIMMAQVENCSKKLIDKGEVWDEMEGDLYLTREDAIEALKRMKIYKESGRATVD